MSEKSQPSILDQAGLTWFNELKNKALAVMSSAPTAGTPQAAAVAAVNKIITLPADSLTQQEVFDLENWLLLLLPDPDLKQWVNSQREDYREAFGKEAFDRIQPTLLPSVSTAATADLQAEARRLQQELHWQASIQPWAQQKRQELMGGILSMLLLVILVITVFWGTSVAASETHQMQFAAVVALMGALGAFISCLQRVQAADLATSRAIASSRHSRFELGVAVSPLQGTVFALLLTLLLVAGMTPAGFIIPDVSLQSCNCPKGTNTPPTATSAQSDQSKTGSASTPTNPALAERNLPSEKAIPTPTSTNSPALPSTSPATGTPTSPVEAKQAPPDSTKPPGDGGKASQAAGDKRTPTGTQVGQVTMKGKCCFPFFKMWLCFGGGKDVAILLLWAFLAGFSERLVPDMLSRIAEKGKA